MARIEERRTEVQGLETFWRWAEPGSGTVPVLYVHGVPTSSDMWVPFLERTGGAALDLPGFGRSAKPGNFDYSIAGYDRFLEGFLDAAGLERFSLVVHDWGAVGLATAQRLHERLERLVIFSTLPFLPGYEWHRVAKLWRMPVVGEVGMGFTTKLVLRHFMRKSSAVPEGMPKEFPDAAYGHFDHGTQRAILKLYRSAPPPVLAAAGRDLGRIDAPSLLLFGAEDPYVPARFGAEYAKALGGEPELRVIENAGHWSWLDRPELIEDAAAFLSR